MQKKTNILRFLCTLIVLFLATQNIFAQSEKVKNAISDTSLQVQGKIQQENGKFRYDYHDIYQEDSLAKDLQASGYHGGGPSWLGIIYGAFQIAEDNLIDNLEMKVEVTGISFWSSSKDDLDKIGRIVNLIKSDDTVLQAAIDKASELGIMQ